MKHLVIFASGSGTNAENIIRYFNKKGGADVVLVLTPNPSAGVIERCRHLNVHFRIFSKEEWKSGRVLEILKGKSPDLIVLAGFMWLVPREIISAFHDRIINIHPALLPKYGGKGMYGEHVHRAVSQSGDAETGISIHYVNEHYDEGQIIFQQKINIRPNEDPGMIAKKVHELEYRHFPEVIERVLASC